MFRSSRKILQCTFVSSGVDSAVLPNNTKCIQFVRGVRPRKPLYSGIAKSKLFRILPRHRENVPELERAEVRRLENNYTSLMKSIVNFCREENARHESGSQIAEEEIAAEEQAWQESLQKIKEWNASIALAREERRAIESKEREARVQNDLKEQEAVRLKLIKEAEEIILREKELYKTYITAENIDAAIERAIDDVQDFNFAVDFQGRIYKGRYTRESQGSASSSLDMVNKNPPPPALPLTPNPSKDVQI